MPIIHCFSRSPLIWSSETKFIGHFPKSFHDFTILLTFPDIKIHFKSILVQRSVKMSGILKNAHYSLFFSSPLIWSSETQFIGHFSNSFYDWTILSTFPDIKRHSKCIHVHRSSKISKIRKMAPFHNSLEKQLF